MLSRTVDYKHAAIYCRYWHEAIVHVNMSEKYNLTVTSLFSA